MMVISIENVIGEPSWGCLCTLIVKGMKPFLPALFPIAFTGMPLWLMEKKMSSLLLMFTLQEPGWERHEPSSPYTLTHCYYCYATLVDGEENEQFTAYVHFALIGFGKAWNLYSMPFFLLPSLTQQDF